MSSFGLDKIYERTKSKPTFNRFVVGIVLMIVYMISVMIILTTSHSLFLNTDAFSWATMTLIYVVFDAIVQTPVIIFLWNVYFPWQCSAGIKVILKIFRTKLLLLGSRSKFKISFEQTEFIQHFNAACRVVKFDNSISTEFMKSFSHVIDSDICHDSSVGYDLDFYGSTLLILRSQLLAIVGPGMADMFAEVLISMLAPGVLLCLVILGLTNVFFPVFFFAVLVVVVFAYYKHRRRKLDRKVKPSVGKNLIQETINKLRNSTYSECVDEDYKIIRQMLLSVVRESPRTEDDLEEYGAVSLRGTTLNNGIHFRAESLTSVGDDGSDDMPIVEIDRPGSADIILHQTYNFNPARPAKHSALLDSIPEPVEVHHGQGLEPPPVRTFAPRLVGSPSSSSPFRPIQRPGSGDQSSDTAGTDRSKIIISKSQYGNIAGIIVDFMKREESRYDSGTAPGVPQERIVQHVVKSLLDDDGENDDEADDDVMVLKKIIAKIIKRMIDHDRVLLVRLDNPLKASTDNDAKGRLLIMNPQKKIKRVSFQSDTSEDKSNNV